MTGVSSRQIMLACVAASTLGLSACSSVGGGGFGGGYSLVRQGRVVNVGSGAMSVTAPREWNRADRSIFSDVRWVEDWTLNGPYLDGISFVAGLPDNQRLLREDYKADRQVPRFRQNMTAPEVAAMLESLYRVAGGASDFRTLALVPRQFLDTPGFQLDYEHLDGDEVWRRGRAVGSVINGRLYLMMFDAARSHYYQAALPDFEAMVGTARRRR
jgi:hypothetical protein